MDLHLNTTNDTIYARLDDGWVKWEHLSDELLNPRLPKIKLMFQRTKGLTWATFGAYNVEKYRTKGQLSDLKTAIRITLENHPLLTGLPQHRKRPMKREVEEILAAGRDGSNERGSVERQLLGDGEEEHTPTKRTRLSRRLSIRDEESQDEHMGNSDDGQGVGPRDGGEAGGDLEVTNSGPSSPNPILSPIERLRNNTEAFLSRIVTEFPKKSPIMAWANGVFTVMPWKKGLNKEPNPVS